MRNWLVLGCVAGLAACSPSQDKEQASPEPTASGASPTSAEDEAARFLLTKFTRPQADQAAASGEFVPRDNCVMRKGAEEFRLALADAVLKRDADALVALADDDIKLDFGGAAGPATLRERLADPDYKLWQELEDLLPLGCESDSEDQMIMPSYFSHDFGDTDPFTVALVTGNGVPLYKANSAESGSLGTLDWDAVELVTLPREGDALAHVKTLSGSEGYMPADKLRYLLDYRMIANRQNGKWKITAFLAGD